MSDFSVRSDNVDVEQIMRQIRSRIREKRGVDYTEEEVRELANVKLEKFLDPKGVRSDLLQQYRRAREAGPPANYKFEDTTIFETHRPVLAFIRRLLRPVLKLFFNPNPVIEALHIQSKLNEEMPLQYELMHNLVIELTRTAIEVKSLKMRLESIASRLDFDERRARALEGVVQYRPGAAAPLQPPTRDQSQSQSQSQNQSQRQGQNPSRQPGQFSNALDNEGNERRARRRRRRGRRRGGDGRGPMPDNRPPMGDAAGSGEPPADRTSAPLAPRPSEAEGATGSAPEPVAPKPQSGEGG